MQQIKLDVDNNIVIEKGDFVVIDGINACAQDTKNRIGIVKGEDPYDTDKGTDYYNELLGKMGGEDFIRAEIRKRILDSDEIIGITRMTLEHGQQQVTITADITTIYGRTTI